MYRMPDQKQFHRGQDAVRFPFAVTANQRANV
jgi:hypothetical protein